MGKKQFRVLQNPHKFCQKKKKRKNFSSTTVWEREGWDMINENRRETTQVGGVWGEKPPQYEERYDPSWWSERGLWNESSVWRLVYPP